MFTVGPMSAHILIQLEWILSNNLPSLWLKLPLMIGMYMLNLIQVFWLKISKKGFETYPNHKMSLVPNG